MFASMRFRARIIGESGAVAGLFTFFDDKNEADIEILTRDPNSTYRFTNQPSVDKKGNDVPSASQAPTGLPVWTDWRVHRIDWVKGTVRWYVDDQLVATNTYNVPRKPSGIVLNMWSDGGVWGGNMTVGDSAEMHVQWVQVAFNTSGKRTGPGKHRGNKKRSLDELEDERDATGLHDELHDSRTHWFQKRKSKACSTVCAIDDVSQVGTPEIRFTASAPSRAEATGSLMLATCLALGMAFMLL
jgi:beta-glucanase (GH16 family)